MSHPTVIGVDVGTSSVKAVAFTPGARPGPVVRRPLVTVADAPGHATQDPGRVREALFDALRSLIADLESAPRVIALSTAMHGLVGLDAHGEPVTPMLTWADDRAQPIVDGWITDGSAAFIHDRTGVPLHPMAPLAEIVWWNVEHPGVSASVVRWADLKTLVMTWLTGEVLTDTSSASGWGLLDVRRRVWDDEALDLAGIDSGDLPGLASPTTRLPIGPGAAAAIGAPVEVEIVIGAGDGPLGNVGVGAVEPGVAAVSLGTSGAVRVVVDHVPDPDPALFCYVLDDERWVVGAAVSNAGNVVGWLARLIGIDAGAPPGAVADEVIRLATQAPAGSDGLVMVPYLRAERAPLWDPHVAGTVLGLRAGHGPAHLARAALEGVCAALGVTTDRLDAAVGVSTVRATGGALDHDVWRTVLAASLGRPTTVVSSATGSATGAAALGLVALGVAPDAETARRAILGPEDRDPPVETVSPVQARAARDIRRIIAGSPEALRAVAAAFAPRAGRG